MAISKNTMRLQRYDAINPSAAINFRFCLRAASPVLLALLAIAFLATTVAVAQDVLPASPADAQIATALQRISSTRIQATIDKLVSFQTRSTLSAQDPAAIAASHGIGAAREWIKSEFERYSHDCGGCLEVKLDTFTEVAGRTDSKTHRNHECLCGDEGN